MPAPRNSRHASNWPTTNAIPNRTRASPKPDARRRSPRLAPRDLEHQTADGENRGVEPQDARHRNRVPVRPDALTHDVRTHEREEQHQDGRERDPHPGHGDRRAPARCRTIATLPIRRCRPRRRPDRVRTRSPGGRPPRSRSGNTRIENGGVGPHALTPVPGRHRIRRIGLHDVVASSRPGTRVLVGSVVHDRIWRRSSRTAAANPMVHSSVVASHGFFRGRAAPSSSSRTGSRRRESGTLIVMTRPRGDEHDAGPGAGPGTRSWSRRSNGADGRACPARASA